jgi:hypothetical protein
MHTPFANVCGMMPFWRHVLTEARYGGLCLQSLIFRRWRLAGSCLQATLGKSARDPILTNSWQWLMPVISAPGEA